jgi:hypothetical protein
VEGLSSRAPINLYPTVIKRATSWHLELHGSSPYNCCAHVTAYTFQKLSGNVGFGRYWFSIRVVKLQNEERLYYAKYWDDKFTHEGGGGVRNAYRVNWVNWPVELLFQHSSYFTRRPNLIPLFPVSSVHKLTVNWIVCWAHDVGLTTSKSSKKGICGLIKHVCTLWNTAQDISLVYKTIQIFHTVSVIMSCLLFKTRRFGFGNWILSPSSGGTYSGGPNRKS